MVTIPPRPFRRHRGSLKQKPAPAPAPPVALTLVAASYDPDGQTVTLTFDRAIDLAGLDGSRIIVLDQANTGADYEATGTVAQPLPESVVMGLFYMSDDSGPQVLLNAGAGNGIVAVDNGAVWAGVSGVVLPFG